MLLFSSFEEALYIDSDNVMLEDLSDLFDYPEYKRTGMLLWPDYWKSTVAPDFFTIAPEAKAWEGESKGSQPSVFSATGSAAALSSVPRLKRLTRASLAGSVETGQLVVTKRICWRAMQLVLFLNLQGSLYYTLLTN